MGITLAELAHAQQGAAAPAPNTPSATPATPPSASPSPSASPPSAPPPAAPAAPPPAPPAPSPPATPPTDAPPAGAPGAPAEDDATVDVESQPGSAVPPSPAPAGTGSSPAPSATPPITPPAAAPVPVPAAPPPSGTAKAAASPRASQSPEGAPKPAAEKTSKPAAEVTAEPSAATTDSVLDDAGYTLTPGVSALPIKPGFVFSGYLQGQYEAHQDSVDQLRQDGVLLNQNRFLVRRGRFKIARDWKWAQVLFELDGNTIHGPLVRVQKAELSLVYGRSKDRDQPPIAELTIGQFDLPFGFEVPYVPKVRWFMERTLASRALFPGEPDVGVRFSGGLGFARYSMAVTNGQPLDDKSGFQLQDPNSNKDFTVRLGAETKASRSFVVAGGISYNRGKGFAAGTTATKNGLLWTDRNGDSRVDVNSGELTAAPSSAAVPSKNFDRWGVGADLELLLRTGLGWSMLYGELVAASNLDRGLFVANPIATSGIDSRELGYYVAFTQEITPYGVVGFRYDYYDPNADFLENRQGKALPTSERIRTYSPLVGLVLPKRARLLFQYDFIDDLFARDARGVPTDFKNNEWTLRLQVNL